MPPIRRDSVSSLLAPDLFRVVVETGKERPLEGPMWVNVVDMPWNPVTDRQASGLATMPNKPEGSQYPGDDPIIGPSKTYTAVPYGLAAEVTFEAWDDELYGYLRDLMRELKRSSNNRLEVDAHNQLNEAFVTTNETGFDSASMISTAHTALDGRTSIANRPAVDVGFGLTAIQNAIVSFHNMVDERNLPRLMSPVMTIIAPENLFTARELLGSSGKPFTANNEMNALLQENLSWMVSHYLNTSTNWFVLAAKSEHDINFMMRNRPIFDAFDDPRTKNAVFTVYQRHDPSSHGSYQGTYGSTG